MIEIILTLAIAISLLISGLIIYFEHTNGGQWYFNESYVFVLIALFAGYQLVTG